MAEHTLMKLLAEVGRERARQDAKFGPQDYPLVPGDSSRELYTGSANTQKRINDRAIEDGTRTGDHVLLEEVFEALSADGPLEAVRELVQVAAVALLLAEMEVRRENSARPPHVWAGGGRHHDLCRVCGELEDVFAHQPWAQVPSGQSAPVTMSSVCSICHHVKNWHAPGPKCSVGDCLCRTFVPEAKETPTVVGGHPVDTVTTSWLAQSSATPRHRWTGADRLHGLCRCGEPRDASVHAECPGHPLAGDGPYAAARLDGQCAMCGLPVPLSVLEGGHAVVPGGYNSGTTISMDDLRAALERPSKVTMAEADRVMATLDDPEDWTAEQAQEAFRVVRELDGPSTGADWIGILGDVIRDADSATRQTTRMHAKPGTRFAPDAFDSQVGHIVPVTVNGRKIGERTVLAATVSPDGTSVELTLEIPGNGA